MRWQSFSTDNVIAFHLPGHLEQARKLTAHAEESARTIRARLRLPASNKLRVYFYPSHRLFTRDTQTDPHLLIVGLAYGKNDTIRVDASGLFEEAGPVLAHEIVHILLGRAVSGNREQLPLWMNEGLAKYLTEPWHPETQERLADAVVRGKLIPLEKLSDRFPADPEGNALAYLQSASFVAYLDALYGEEAFPKLIHLLSKGYGLYKALMTVFGSGLNELENNWKGSLRETYRWTPWANIAPWAVGILFVLIFGAGYLTFLRKRRRLIEKWQEEERDEPEEAAED